ncbi:MAG: hypothetical protein HeimC3_18570 [Candidatus Heimdallarchaeota archaeon LC_3]|nr:MAG: hypothetical protein HeimC3_18570 [Candidatus Heimdallarchaeota archaeon LC_3]
MIIQSELIVSTLKNLILDLEPSIDDFSEEYPELYQFWSENFQSYLKKSIKKLKKQNFRRNFQGRVVDSILTKESPDLILNLFSGYLGSFHAVFSNKFFSLKESDNNNSGTNFLWINIDLLPESAKANCDYLQDYWGYRSKKLENSNYSWVTSLPNGLMYHLTGDLTKIENLIPSWEKLCSSFTKPVLLGIEGIMNLPLLVQKDMVSWWNQFNDLIRFSHLFFGSWMSAGDSWEGLITKIIFYQDVVKVKHHQPLNFGKLESINVLDNKNEESNILFESKLPWNIQNIKEKIIPKIESQTSCVVISFYSSENSSKSNLRFVSSYITNEALRKLCNNSRLDSHELWLGYLKWEEYFGLNIEKKEKKTDSFVKILPFGFKSLN